MVLVQAEPLAPMRADRRRYVLPPTLLWGQSLGEQVLGLYV